MGGEFSRIDQGLETGNGPDGLDTAVLEFQAGPGVIPVGTVAENHFRGFQEKAFRDTGLFEQAAV